MILGYIDDLKQVQAVINNFPKFDDDGITNALSDLSKEQLTLLSTSKMASAELKNQAASKLALIGTTNQLTAAQTAERLESALGSAEDAKQLLVKSGLITAEELEKDAVVKLNAEEVEAILIKKEIVGADLEAAMSSLGLSTANTTAAFSFDLLKVKILEASKALITFLATNPIGWIISFTAGLFALTKAYDFFTLSSEEAAESASESYAAYEKEANALQDLQSELDATKEKIDELNSKDKLTLTEEAELEKLQAQNKELDRKIALQEKSAKIAAQESIKDTMKVFQLKDTEDYSQEDVSPGSKWLYDSKFADHYEKNDILTATSNNLKVLSNYKDHRNKLLAELDKPGADIDSINTQIGNLDANIDILEDKISESIKTISTNRDYFFDTNGELLEDLTKDQEDMYWEMTELIDEWNGIDLTKKEKELSKIESYFSKPGRNVLKEHIIKAVNSGKDASDAFEEMGLSLDDAGISAQYLNRYFNDLKRSANEATEAANNFEPPKVEDVEIAFESEDQGANYDSMAEKWAQAKELVEQGLYGKDEVQVMTQWILPEDIDDNTFGSKAYIDAWEKAYNKVNDWFNTENPQEGMWSFLDELKKSDKTDFFTKYDKSTGLVKFSKDFTNSAQAAEELGVSLDVVETMLHKLEEYGFTFDETFQWSGEQLSEYEDALSNIRELYNSTDDEALKERLGGIIDQSEIDDFANNLDKLTEDKIIQIKFEYDLATIDEEIANLKEAAAFDGYGSTEDNASIMATYESRKSKWEEKNKKATKGGYSEADSAIEALTSSMTGKDEDARAEIQRKILAIQELQVAYQNAFDSGEVVNWKEFLGSDSMEDMLKNIEEEFGFTKEQIEEFLNLDIPESEAKKVSGKTKETSKNKTDDPDTLASDGKISDFGEEIATFFSITIPQKWEEFLSGAGEWFSSTGEWIENVKQKIADFFTVTIPEKFGEFLSSVEGKLSEVGAWVEGVKEKIVNFFTVTIPDKFEEFLGKIKEQLSEAGTWVKGVKQKIVNFFTVTIPDKFEEFLSGIEAQFSAAREWANGVRQKVVNFFTITVPAKIEEFLGNVERFFIETLPYAIGCVGGKIAAFFIETVPQKIEEFVNKLKNIIEEGKNKVEEIKSAINNFFAVTVPNAWNELLDDIGSFLFETIPTALSKIKDGVVNFFTVTVPNAIKEFLEEAKGFLSESKSDVNKVRSQIKNFFMVTIPNAFKELLEDVKAYISENISPALNNIKNKVKNFFMSTLPGVWNELLDDVENLLFEVIPTGLSKIKNKCVNFFTVVIPNVWNEFWASVKSYIDENVTPALTSVKNKVQNFFTVTLTNAWNEFWSSVGAFLFETVPTALEEVKNGITTFFTVTLPNSINNLWTSISSWISEKASTFWENLKAGFNAGYNNNNNSNKPKGGGKPTEGGGGLNGTAHKKGTAVDFYTGSAYANGNIEDTSWLDNSWKTGNGEVALTGEVGQEMVVHGNRWWTVGDNGAEFSYIPPNSVIFDAEQTKQLLTKGHIKGRGKAFLHGTAYKTTPGSGGWLTHGSSGSPGNSGNNSGNKGNNNNNNNNNNDDSLDKTNEVAEEFKETLDWIERKIKDIEREIENLDQGASATYRSWSDRNKDLANEMALVSDEILVQKKAYQRYMQEANSVGLDPKYVKLVQEGKINIEDIEDEKLAEKISQYQEYYDKALECKDATQDLTDKLAELARQKFDNVAQQFDDLLSKIEHNKNVLDALISKTETDGHIVSEKYYQKLITQETNNRNMLIDKKAALEKKLAEAVASGHIKKGSEEWYAMQNEINSVEEAIIAADEAIIKYGNDIRQLKWDAFDRLQDSISNVAKESDFLIGLMENKDLYDDNGQFTDEGMATMGLHGQNHNTYMAQADMYADEIAEIDKLLKEDPYDQELLARRQELVEAQWDSIEAAEAEKQAIIDMVEEGIKIELEALQEKIDKYKEAQNAAKDLYDYQKKIEDQVNEISRLEKQLNAYQGDDSEENKKRVQEIKVKLDEAKENLEQTEMEHALEESQKMLDELYDKYEEVLNQRLEDVDALFEEMIGKINENAGSINQTLKEQADSVGVTLSGEMQDIWGNKDGAKDVLTTYGENFCNKLTSVNDVLKDIKKYLEKMIDKSDKEADDETGGNGGGNRGGNGSGGGRGGNKPVNNDDKDNNKPNNKTIKVGGKIKASGAKIYDYKGDKTGERQKFRDDPVYKVLKVDGNWLQVRHHKLNKGVTGWFKKGDVKAYKTGGLVDETGLAWLDGTKKKPEMVLNAKDTENLIELTGVLRNLTKEDVGSLVGNITPMADSLASNILKPNLVPLSSPQSMNNVFNMNFELHDVQNGEQVINYLINSDRFEDAVKAMTVDRLTGGSRFSKNKYFKKNI